MEHNIIASSFLMGLIKINLSEVHVMLHTVSFIVDTFHNSKRIYLHAAVRHFCYWAII